MTKERPLFNLPVRVLLWKLDGAPRKRQKTNRNTPSDTECICRRADTHRTAHTGTLVGCYDKQRCSGREQDLEFGTFHYIPVLRTHKTKLLLLCSLLFLNTDVGKYALLGKATQPGTVRQLECKCEQDTSGTMGGPMG